VCGIAGVVGGNPAGREGDLAAALHALTHRGPDSSATFGDDDISLGHTRLAIIDPTSASDQPMIDRDSGCVLVYNGEIYNYRELRDELVGRGHRFRSAGDTEVLLRAYLQWGIGCLPRLNGMFAFALWDRRRGELLLARDRLGEKPLHLCRRGDEVWFASEIRALIAARAVVARADRQQLFAFLAYGDLGHPTRTMFADVAQLPAGHAVWLRPGGHDDPVPWPYWELPEASRQDFDQGRFDELFESSVRLRLRSDVPLGTSLSGGLDSSLVLATVRRLRPEGDLHAFTASFPGSPADELPKATEVARKMGVTLHPVPLGHHHLDSSLDAMVASNEGPVESASTLAQFHVMQAAGQAGITVLLDGQGADETWFGYEKYAGAWTLDRIAAGHPLGAMQARREWAEVRNAPPTVPFQEYGGLVAGRAIRRLTQPLAVHVRSPWLATSFISDHATTDVLDGVAQARGTPGRVAEEIARLDLTRITLPRLLRYADRNSMAWSREIRLPFLDHRLVEFAVATGPEAKVVGGWSKEPARVLLDRIGLPAVSRRQDKLAYMPPAAEWLAAAPIVDRLHGAWSDFHRAGVLSGPEPVDALVARWRVLAAHAWTSAFGLSPA
jgi:asparagine synthase (glutamine-hydrolysing)